MSLVASRREQIAVVLVDLDLPGVSGMALVEELRRSEPQIQVLVISGNCSPGCQALLLSLGVRCILDKPFSPRILFQQIDDALIATPPNNA